MTDLDLLIPGRVWERTDWGAPATPGGHRRPLSRVGGYTVHVTETPVGTSVSNIRRYHVGSNNWADIGYHYLIDPATGDVYVGRGRFRTGAHAPGANSDHLGIASICHGDDPITDLEKQAHRGLRLWLQQHGGLPGMTGLNGHRDLSATACPGNRRHRWVSDGMPGPDPERSWSDMASKEEIAAVVNERIAAAFDLGEASDGRHLTDTHRELVALRDAADLGRLRDLQYVVQTHRLLRDAGLLERAEEIVELVDAIDLDDADEHVDAD